jgi:hypothetical protein
MKALKETSTRQEASFWLNAVLSQFNKEVKELRRQGTEGYSQPVADHFLEILNVWQQGRKAFQQGDYPRGLGLAQATQVMINEIDEMKSRFALGVCTSRGMGPKSKRNPNPAHTTVPV